MPPITASTPSLDPLVINSVKVQDGTRFLANGGVQKVTTVTYWLGRHGPFELVYPQGQVSAVQINSDIQQRKNDLAQVNGTGTGG
jgi:hypothetical protein